ncbi:MAG: protein-glutamate O-methyltransferase [Haliangiales bacterium]
METLYKDIYKLTDIRPLGDAEYKRFQRLILQRSGIYLADSKKSLLIGRLIGRIHRLGMKSFEDYYNCAIADPREMGELLDCICTNETKFFREPAHFEYLEQTIIPRFIAENKRGVRGMTVRVWSAACSTGEEAYSLAMSLCWHLPSTSGWKVEIWATDLSRHALAQARRGTWSIAQQSQVPRHYLKRYMLRGVRGQRGMMAAGNALRSVLTFERINLNDDAYPRHGPFDIIFCRNVLIYFESQARIRVIRKLFDCLAHDGYFFMGHSESLFNDTIRSYNVMPNVYTKSSVLSWP